MKESKSRAIENSENYGKKKKKEGRRKRVKEASLITVIFKKIHLLCSQDSESLLLGRQTTKIS